MKNLETQSIERHTFSTVQEALDWIASLPPGSSATAYVVAPAVDAPEAAL